MRFGHISWEKGVAGSRIRAWHRYALLALRLMVEVEGEGALPPLPHDGANLVAFMSFAVSRGFGAQHPLIALADRLHDTHGLSLGPLTTFYEAQVEDAEDATKLELAWQDLALLEGSVAAMAAALASDPQCQALARRAGAEGLSEESVALREALAPFVQPALRVRLSYSL